MWTRSLLLHTTTPATAQRSPATAQRTPTAATPLPPSGRVRSEPKKIEEGVQERSFLQKICKREGNKKYMLLNCYLLKGSAA